MVTHTATLTLGRFILGIAGGIINIVFGKMINETIPEHLIAKFAMTQLASANLGYIATFGPGALLPD